MSNQAERPSSKRLAAASDYERDDDFQFVRKSKKPRTEEPVPEPVKKSRGRPATTKAKPPSQEDDQFFTKTSAASGKRPSRRKGSPEAQAEEPQLKVAKRPTASTARKDTNVEKPVPVVPDEPEHAQINGAAPRQKTAKKGKTSRAAKISAEEMSHHEPSVGYSKIALPMSDTPVINRNKEMRKKGGGNRRSSLGSRGRRASSLIESGQTAIPHRDVNPAEFYKHIAAEGLPEPRRMKQLLTWCGERSLLEKPPLGTPNSNAILGARAIQDQLLKDFATRSDFSDWFSRDEAVQPQTNAVLQPNPRNIELDEKMTQLEARIARLQEEKKAWLSIRKPAPQIPPLFPDAEDQQITLPDFDLLDPDEGKIRNSLADESVSFHAVRSNVVERLRKVQSTLEFQVDLFADNVHKLEQRVTVAGREADEVLRLSALRLKQREDREKARTRTKELPVMEVLRSLSNVLPEGG